MLATNLITSQIWYRTLTVVQLSSAYAPYMLVFCKYAGRATRVVLQEKESLTKASELLQKLGYKGSIFQDAPASSESDGSKKDDA